MSRAPEAPAASSVESVMVPPGVGVSQCPYPSREAPYEVLSCASPSLPAA
jgi:hypothetical protein